jgi:murein DD-endopeptidase MepM/ murein hydrolase activator NlpD
VSLISLLIVVGTFLPSVARASILSTILSSIKLSRASAETIEPTGNLQTMALLQAAMNLDPVPALGGGDIVIRDSALQPQEGPEGTIADIVKPKNSMISIHIVREGETLSEIAALYDVTANTILWANDISRASSIRVGQQLTILPITGVRYTVKKGDTLSSIAKRYEADAEEIANFNGLDGAAIAVGSEILIPNGVAVAPSAPAVRSKSVAAAPVTVAATVSSGYFSSPLSRYTKTQGIHGYNGVDLAAANGTPILAAAAGDVIVAKGSGYNGGYGAYVVIKHDNGTQTLYAHASSVIVSVGQRVQQGQVIAYVGNTGRSTGAHLHFEVRGGTNPF